MVEEFSYAELMLYIKGEADSVLSARIEAAVVSDQDLRLAIENLRNSMPLINVAIRKTRKDKLGSWMKEDPASKKNYFQVLRYAAVIMLLVTGGIFLILRYNDHKQEDLAVINVIKDTIERKSSEAFVSIDSANTKHDSLSRVVHYYDPKKESENKSIGDIPNKSTQYTVDDRNKSELLAYQEIDKEAYLDQYEFDNISVNTRGTKVDDWKYEAKKADSLYQLRHYSKALEIYKSLDIHPEIWERLAFSYSRLRQYSSAFDYYAKYKAIGQASTDESDWGEWLLYLNALPSSKLKFDEKTREILAFKDHKYFEKVEKIAKKFKIK